MTFKKIYGDNPMAVIKHYLDYGIDEKRKAYSKQEESPDKYLKHRVENGRKNILVVAHLTGKNIYGGEEALLI